MLFPNLTTQRLSLRQADPKDLEAIYKGLSNPKVIEYYGIAYQSKQEAKVQLEWYDYVWANEEGVYWMITDKQTGRFLGTIGYYNWMQANRKAEIGFWLNPSDWRNGFMAEAMAPVLQYGFKTLNLHRVEALVEEENAAAIGLLLTHGFKHEGTMRECELKEDDTKLISLKLFGLLSQEYKG